MKIYNKSFKILTATLIALITAVVLHKLVYSTFCIVKAGQVFYYNWDLWKQYWAWLPGKIICIVLATLIILLLCESMYFIFCIPKHKKRR